MSSSSSASPSSSSHAKLLNPIYAALDNKQYGRAIKLCLADAGTTSHNVHVQALLAHAYAQTEQRAAAIAVLARILLGKDTNGGGGGDSNDDTNDDGDNNKNHNHNHHNFEELQLALKYAQTGVISATVAAAAATETVTSGTTRSSKSGGKKGKKKPVKAVVSTTTTTTTITTTTTTTTTTSPATRWDWIDALDTAPTLSSDCLDRTPPPIPWQDDYTLLSTIQMTLVHVKLTLTAYQLYAGWWAQQQQQQHNHTTTTTTSLIVDHLQETFHLGLAVYMAPQYQYLPLRDQLLPQLQVLALQLARYQHHHHHHHHTTSTSTTTTMIHATPTTLWAAQTALWQCHPDDNDDHNNNNPVPPQKLALLPRLAASMAAKVVEEHLANTTTEATTTTTTSRFTVEAVLLWLQALEMVEDWSAYQAALERVQPVLSSWQTTKRIIQAYAALGDTEKARATAANALRTSHPDQWDTWLWHLTHDTTDGYAATTVLARELTTTTTTTTTSPYPRRAPPLIILEALRRRIIQSTAKQASLLVPELMAEIQSYGDTFAVRTACTFADLQECLQCICQHATEDQVVALLQWLAPQQTCPTAADAATRRGQLRAYIFAHQTALTLLRHFDNLQHAWLPDWKDLVRTWQDFSSFEEGVIAAQTAEERQNAQKESRPADEILLLAVQLLLEHDNSRQAQVMAAVLLDKAIAQSPYNAYLKLAQIAVCGDLQAAGRAWDLFRELFIKHIQHESCAYLILPHLMAGGLYQEVIQVCREIIRLQVTALNDAIEFTPQALKNGTVSQADEFIRFQRERMNKSLTTLEAKGLMMNCAPLFTQDDRLVDIGAVHGIVGGEHDFERVQQIIADAHTPLATFSLLRIKGSVQENAQRFSENRDLKALTYQVYQFRKFPTREEIVCDCIRRAHQHNLLLRASLCLDATKGPKKGKVVKPSEELAARCKSLIARVNEAESFVTEELSGGFGLVILSMTSLCRAIAVLSGGFGTSEPLAEDSVALREDKTAEFLQQATEHLSKASTRLNLRTAPALTGLAIPDIIIPLLALLRMCATVNEVYGWTKKRRSIRKCAGCLYDFSLAMRVMLDDMQASLDTIVLELDNFAVPDNIKAGIVPDIVTEDEVGETVFLIQGAQSETKLRIERILQSVRVDLESFDTAE